MCRWPLITFFQCMSRAESLLHKSGEAFKWHSGHCSETYII